MELAPESVPLSRREKLKTSLQSPRKSFDSHVKFWKSNSRILFCRSPMDETLHVVLNSVLTRARLCGDRSRCEL